MSLLSPERYIAVLGPTRVQLARRRRGVLENLGSADGTSTDFADWGASADALERLLAAQLPGRGELAVVLGEHFVRFGLVPWNAAIGSPDELAAYARLGFEDIYGSVAADWVLQLSPEAAGRPRLVAAIDGGLRARLAALAAARRLRLAALQPYLMVAFNRLCRPLAGADFLFLLAEPERSSLLVARAGSWVTARSTVAGDDDASLAVLLERESELQELRAQAPACFYLHTPGRGAFAAPTVHGVQAQLLGGPQQGTADALWTMAMTVS